VPTDLALLMVAAVTALVAGAWYLLAARPAGPAGTSAVRVTLVGASGVCLLAGLVWRAVPTGAWPGATPWQAFALLAGGGLVLFAWQYGRARDEVCGLGLLAAGLTLVAALVAAAATGEFRTPAAPLVQATWPFGLRAVVGGIGLGGWLWALAGSLAALPSRRPVRTGEAATEIDGPTEATGSADATGEPGSSHSAAGDAAPPGAPSAEDNPAAADPIAMATVTPSSVPGDQVGRAALRAAYPWLTLALLAGAGWNLTAYALAWRGTPAEIWLVIAWLLGAAYLHGTGGYRAVKLGRLPLVMLAAAGLAAAVMAATQASTLFW
jgi:hypothetical protein